MSDSTPPETKYAGRFSYEVLLMDEGWMVRKGELPDSSKPKFLETATHGPWDSIDAADLYRSKWIQLDNPD